MSLLQRGQALKLLPEVKPACMGKKNTRHEARFCFQNVWLSIGCNTRSTAGANDGNQQFRARRNKKHGRKKKVRGRSKEEGQERIRRGSSSGKRTREHDAVQVNNQQKDGAMIETRRELALPASTSSIGPLSFAESNGKQAVFLTQADGSVPRKGERGGPRLDAPCPGATPPVTPLKAICRANRKQQEVIGWRGDDSQPRQ